jgi:hypothetical protein
VSRYEINGNWREAQRREVEPWRNFGATPITLVVEVADLRDTQGGHVYTDGAYRVRKVGKGENLATRFRAKTFKGETAWSDAERYFGDWCTAVVHYDPYAGRARTPTGRAIGETHR